MSDYLKIVKNGIEINYQIETGGKIKYSCFCRIKTDSSAETLQCSGGVSDLQ